MRSKDQEKYAIALKFGFHFGDIRKKFFAFFECRLGKFFCSNSIFYSFVRRHSYTLCFPVQLRSWYGARFALLDNESGHSPGDGVSDVAGFVHHALGIVVSLAGRDAARLLPV